MSARLQHVAITFPPGEGARVRDFYGGVLELEEMAVPAEVAHLGWIWFATSAPGVELHFVPHEIAPDPARMHHFCLEVADLAAARRRVEGSGGTVTEPRARIQGRDRLFTRDPLGNLVELVAPLPGEEPVASVGRTSAGCRPAPSGGPHGRGCAPGP